MSVDLAARRASFRRLHESGTFVIPNPWDVGSAKYLRHLGFRALATTSAGFANANGWPDGGAPVDAVLEHVAAIVEATDLPVNADFESAYAGDADEVAANVRRCVDTGVAGLSVEDSTGDAERPLYDLDEAVGRVEAARAAIDESGADVLLTARAECFLVGSPDPLEASIRRLQAYVEAGADVVYAPGPRDPAAIAAIVRAVAPVPVNVLAMPGLTVAQLAELGVRRVSLGSWLARAAWAGFARAAAAIASEGDFSPLADATPYAELNDLFRS